MCGESIELVFDNWQCIFGRAVINNDKIVSMIFLRKFSNSVKGLVSAICFVVNRQNYRYLHHGCSIELSVKYATTSGGKSQVKKLQKKFYRENLWRGEVLLTADKKIDFNLALKVQRRSGTFWNLWTGGSLGVWGCCRNCCCRSPILANLSQMMIFEQADARHSSSTTSVLWTGVAG